MRERSTAHLQTARWLALGLLSLSAGVSPASADEKNDAKKILTATGARGGFIVHLGCGDGKLTAALRADDSYQVHGLTFDKANVIKARKHVESLGVYGPVAIDQIAGKQLPYVDNLINVLVVEKQGDVSMDEIKRVLVPNGVAYVKKNDKWTKTIKPRPKNIDEWTHYLHDPSGNAVAHDDVVGPPRHLQWLGSPRWSRHHDRMASLSAMVSAGGRVYYVMDEGSRTSIQLPSKWTLICRDAFNGVILWKQPIKDWHNQLWPLKSGPTQLARRLVATKDRVYVTLGFEVPLTSIDAKTGKILRTYRDTGSTEEVLESKDVLFVLSNKSTTPLSEYAPLLNLGDQGRIAREFRWNKKPRDIMAVDAKTGKTLWKKDTVAAPLTLALDDERLFYHDDEKVVCLDRKTGKELWTSKPVDKRQFMTFNFGPRLLVQDGIVVFAGGNPQKKGVPQAMTALDAKTGKELWSAPHARSGYQSPEDLLVTGGLVWVAPTTSGRDSGIFTGRDLKTGKVVKEFPPSVKTYWFHHRCYIAKATDKYLLTSRTGIEFVDTEKKDWDINHWVRGGCLYGVMPCNGLVYAPPHNCACYPETKIYGLNALAPAAPTRKLPKKIPDKGRLERGPAYDKEIKGEAAKADWPTYRGDNGRSGSVKTKVTPKVKEAWQTKLGGRLTSVTVAGGKLFVAQVDKHVLHALDAKNGKKLWSYVTGGRIDSPPTYWKGRVLCGSADGYVYCLRAEDGALVYRFRAAPEDRRLMAFEQLESVWPVHGSVLVQDDVAYFVAGRSNFLDGGLRFFRLDPKTGKKLTEEVIDDVDPTNGKPIQDRIQILNMPAGLPDILASDGKKVYMRSQVFDLKGKREELGPHSGDPIAQAKVQRGETAHLFAPMGFLDDSYFHRAYWLYGRTSAGGHSGYSKPGKFAPAGRMMVFDDENVYSFGRKPEHYKWTTILEHDLYAASKIPPEVPDAKLVRRGASMMVQIASTKSLDPAKKAIAVEAWVKAERPGGTILARGAGTNGYALIVRQGRPEFIIRSAGDVSKVVGRQRIVNEWAHVVGALTQKKQLELYVNGKRVATAKASDFIAATPLQPAEIGADDKGTVGTYRGPFPFTGVIDEVQVYHGTLTAEEIAARFKDGAKAKVKDAKVVLSYSFNDGKATDASGNKNDGKIAGARVVDGKLGKGLRFVGRANAAQQGGSYVKRDWAEGVPLFVRAMALAGDTLFVVGPPDLMDETETFKKLAERDKKVQALLKKQDEALNGKQGGVLLVVSKKDGKTLAKHSLKSLPTWDGLAAANGRLYLSTLDGTVLCLGGE